MTRNYHIGRTDMKQKKKDPKPNTVRPAAKDSPFMNKEEFEQLKADIKANRVRFYPIVSRADGRPIG